MNTSVTTAFILAGGLGTRLRGLFPETPKPLIPVGDEAFLIHLVRSLAQQGLTNFILSLGYRSDQFSPVIEKLRNEGFQISTVIETQPLGTGGALKLARLQLQSRPFLLVNGDTFFEGSLRDLLQPSRDALVTLGAVFVDDSSRYGRIFSRDDQVHFAEKGQAGPGWVNAGLAVCQPEIFDQLPSEDVFSLEKDVFEKQSASIRLVQLEGRFFDLGLPSSYSSFQLDWILRNASSVERIFISTFWNSGRIWAPESLCRKMLSQPDDRIALNALPSMDMAPLWLRRSEPRDLVITHAQDQNRFPNGIAAKTLLLGEPLTQAWKWDAHDNEEQLLEAWSSSLEKWRTLQTIENIDFPTLSPSRPALFLDRDGVMIDHVDYLCDPDEVRIKPGLIDLLKAAEQLGWATIVITNQSGLGRESFSYARYLEVTRRLRELLAEKGVSVERICMSPFYLKSQRAFGLLEPSLRKPRPGMILTSARTENVDLERSVFIGDNHTDLLAAESAGIPRKILLRSKIMPDESSRLNTLNVNFEMIESLIDFQFPS